MFIDPIPTLNDLNLRSKDTMAEWIGIEYCDIGPDYLVARMPADHRTFQPLKMINGGAYCTLAETVGSMAANLCIDRSKKVALGLDINANHIKSVSQGFVYGKATPLHIGKTTQVWEIKITNEKNQLCCISRLTMAVVNLPES
jgi:1,4-dihydroxy-2-naphthoyl-CoA hydrolase